MQGRITKVLNMKPNEILSMIEEAAGTSMYESKREATTKKIQQKDAKLQEIETVGRFFYACESFLIFVKYFFF